MNITTSPKIWAHRSLLTLVHQANEIIELEAGPNSESLAVYWGLAEAQPEVSLQVTVVDAATPQTPFNFADLTDLEALRQKFRRWCGVDSLLGGEE